MADGTTQGADPLGGQPGSTGGEPPSAPHAPGRFMSCSPPSRRDVRPSKGAKIAHLHLT